MDFGTFRALTLLAFLLAGPATAQRGDAEAANQSSGVGEESLKEILKKVERCQSTVDAVDTLEARLNETLDELARQKAETEQLKKDNEGLKIRLNATEKDIDDLKKASDEAAPRVAFSASLTDSDELYRGPSPDRTLVFKRVFANFGDGYDVDTGTFTAPLSGFYFFSFSTYGYNTHTTGAILLKNHVRQVSTFDPPTADGADGSGNAAVLRLAAGDAVHMELWDDGRVYDNLNGHTTFTGFLLFPA